MCHSSCRGSATAACQVWGCWACWALGPKRVLPSSAGPPRARRDPSIVQSGLAHQDAVRAPCGPPRLPGAQAAGRAQRRPSGCAAAERAESAEVPSGKLMGPPVRRTCSDLVPCRRQLRRLQASTPASPTHQGAHQGLHLCWHEPSSCSRLGRHSADEAVASNGASSSSITGNGASPLAVGGNGASSAPCQLRCIVHMRVQCSSLAT